MHIECTYHSLSWQLICVVKGYSHVSRGLQSYVVMHNTHCQRDDTVELRRVGVGGVNTINNYLTTSADGFGRQFGN